ncbi:arginase family protein, partial [Halobium palmae]
MFPGANADRGAADYVVVGAPLDVSTSFRPGARFGPDRVRRFAEPFDDYDRRTDRRFTDLSVHDAGDVRAWDDAPDYLQFLEGACRDVVRDDAVPLVLGGEHTV